MKAALVVCAAVVLGTTAALAQQGWTKERWEQLSELEKAMTNGCLNKQAQEPANQGLRPLAVYQYCNCIAKYMVAWITPNDMELMEKNIEPPWFKRIQQEAVQACPVRR